MNPIALNAAGSGGAGPTVRQIVLDYLALRAIDCKAGLIGASFLLRVNRMLGDFCAQFGSEPAAAIRPSHVRGWILGHTGWKSDCVREAAGRCVKALFAWAADEDLIEKDRIRRLKPCWGTPTPRGHCTPAEYAAIMRTARHYTGRGRRRRSVRAFRLALFFLHETGCRTCEMRAADWAQVKWQAGIVEMAHSKTTRKTGRKRRIPLNAVVLRLLRWMHRRAGYPQTGRIFCCGIGTPWDKVNFAKVFKKIARVAGVWRPGLSPYCLRHTYCVNGLEAGIGHRQLADALGHTTTRFVEWYGRDTQGNADYLRGVAEDLRRHREREQQRDQQERDERGGAA